MDDPRLIELWAAREELKSHTKRYQDLYATYTDAMKQAEAAKTKIAQLTKALFSTIYIQAEAQKELALQKKAEQRA